MTASDRGLRLLADALRQIAEVEWSLHALQQPLDLCAAAARAGDPDSIIAFNPGVLNPIISLSEHEDYTAGEINEPGQVQCPGRWVNGTQFHLLSYLGPSWAQGPPRFANQQIIEWTRGIIARGGVVTWDVPIRPNGLIPQEFVEQLKALCDGLR